MHSLIDGDVIVYRAGFASDAVAKAEYIDRFGSAEGYDPKEHHEPLPHALQIVKRTLTGILDTVNANRYTVVISHPVNYREQFFPDYKMNRDITHKPFWYKEIQNYLFEHHAAIYSEQGDEADDYLGILQMNYLMEDKESIICSIDKDLNMIPGLHYNFSKNNEANGIYEIQDPEALRLFYQQIVTGDSADNIPGMYKKLGKKATKKYTDPIETMTNSREMYQYVLDLYEGDKAHVDLMGKLLWIKRDPNWWSPPE